MIDTESTCRACDAWIVGLVPPTTFPTLAEHRRRLLAWIQQCRAESDGSIYRAPADVVRALRTEGSFLSIEGAVADAIAHVFGGQNAERALARCSRSGIASGRA